MVKTYTKKNGEVITKDYDQKKYNKTYYEKNKDKMKVEDRYICDACNSSVVSTNKWNHNKSLKHQLYTELKNKDKV
jgi:hypothetical protein